MKNLAEIEAAFDALPSRVTAAQIAEATDRTHIHNWVKDPTFPAGRNDLGGRTIYRDRDAVWEWYAAQSFAGTDRPGPRDLNAKVLAARPTQVLMDSAELGGLLDLTRRAVNKYAERNQAGTSKDPFPLANPDGKRSWSQVRAWFLRRSDPMPSAGTSGTPDWANLRVWLLRHVEDGAEPVNGRVYLDELGLTIGQRDVVERAHIARAAGANTPVEWLAEVLHFDEPGQAEWLDMILSQPDVAPIAPTSEHSHYPVREPRRLKPTALGRELGLSTESVKHFARSYTPGRCEDPFPPKDSSSARDIEEVSAWLIRNKKTSPVLAEDPATVRRERRGQRLHRARDETPDHQDNASIRAWAKESGHEISDRGPIPAEIRAAYEKANG